MAVPLWFAVVLMAVGTVAIVRAAFLVASNATGRFRGDPLITMIGGFALVLLGQHLLSQ